uniref:Angiotensin-converting enzyme n=1 Tax=Paramormyrops kingsleyae TaxID=1676925 RepID=A0A3B3STC4_9TELE
MHAALLLLLAGVWVARGQSDVEQRAVEFLKRFDENATQLMYQHSLASWAYNTNITSENADKLSQQGEIWGSYYSQASEESLTFPLNEITDPTIKVQLMALQDKGSGALTKDKLDRLNKVMNEMSTIYSTGTVCKLDNPFDCQTLEPGLESVMAQSTDYYQRLHVWEGWRVEVGKKMRPLYEDYVELKDEAAKLNGYADYGDYWRGNYETTDDGKYSYTRDELMSDVRRIYQEIMPLYKELHAYVRSKLHLTYPGHISEAGGLPAHLLGDMWGRFWTNLYPLSVPYPDKPDIDVTSAMISQAWTVDRLFKEAEKFFMSVNLYQMLPNFWENSMFVKPDDGRMVVCHPTAWDMETEINFLMKQALTIVATLPFTYMLEEWRWEVFQGTIPKDQWMQRWWEMKRDMVGVVEPLPRDETYCDPAALFHVANDYSFIRYFTRTIYQFQFQASLCETAGHTGPLFKCDITNSKPAGEKLRAMLELGKSKSWTRALEQVSGVTRMDSKPLLEYFRDLHIWLQEENRKNNRFPGWNVAADPYSKEAFKVRLSLKAAMGDQAYQWNDNELYLFKATIAYAMRLLSNKGRSSLSIKYNVTGVHRLSRGRINSAFLLDDKTLEFEGIISTLSPPVEPAVTVWLVVFGVIMGLSLLLGTYLIISGVWDRKKSKKEEAENPAENPYENHNEGVINQNFEHDTDDQTGF